MTKHAKDRHLLADMDRTSHHGHVLHLLMPAFEHLHFYSSLPWLFSERTHKGQVYMRISGKIGTPRTLPPSPTQKDLPGRL